jgi:hypothetical protein
VKASELYQSPYLSGEDVKGKSVACKIEAISIGEFDDRALGKRAKILLVLKDIKKPMVVGTMNARILIAKLGDDTDTWIGCEVLLTSALMIQGGKPVNALVIAEAVRPPDKHLKG